MKPVKALFLKTYGKQRRKLPAWVSPENRKRVFDSTDSADGDISVFEPAKPPRKRERSTSVARRRGARAAKKKAMLCLTEKTFDEESFNNEEIIVIPSPPPPQAPQQSKTTRGKKTRVSSGRVRPAKRKAVSSLTENSSDEENIGRPFPQCPQPAQQSKTSRKKQLTSVPGVLIRQKRQQVPVTIDSEEDSRVHHHSVGRFVTRRRCGAVVKPKLQKMIVSILNSSDDFTSGGLRSRRRKVPPVFLVSSPENSVNAAGTSSFATNPLREISLNESADCSVGPSPRNPIFCSTPSAGSFSKHPHLKPIPINDKSSSPPSMSVSSTGVISTFEEDLNSPGQPVSEPHSALSTGLHSEGKLLSSLEVLSCSGDSTEGMTVSDRQSINSSRRPVAHTQSSDPETEEKAEVISMLKEKCLSVKPAVEIKRLTLSQLRHKKRKSPSAMSDPASDEQKQNDHQSVSDANLCHENTNLKVRRKKWSSTSSEDKISSDKEVVKSSCDVLPKRKKLSLAPRDKKMRITSTDQPGTTRKACVSGMSVSRWKNKSSAHTRPGDVKPVDCSINDLISTKHKPQRELGTVMNFSTPVKVNPLNLSSLLADFTPNTHTWSRLKAALSVHRKVHLSSSHLSGSPGRTALAELSQDLFATPFRTLLPRHLQSQLCHDSPCEDADLSDAEKVYAECGQKHPLPWEESILPHRMKRCVKIGEGTFGEVFSTTNASGDTVALKIIPVEGSEKVNGEAQKIFGEILHEIIISKELSSLKEKKLNQTHSFIGLNDLHCVRGCYPPDFLNAWDKFDQQKGSENDRPDFFEEDQLFLILEFEFGGVDLENSNGTLAYLAVAKSILHQVTAALAVAEEELHFEHRDLHWGNVLVKTTKQKTGSFLLNGTAHSLETKGVLVRIIDYSLSRLAIDDLTVSCDISKDEELFMGQGDYQFDIYRLMRQENGNNWSGFHPHTNVLWLHYLCSKLLSMKYRTSGGRGAKDVRAALTRFYDNILQYSSATEALHTCPMFQ
ncbi:unnamed protein product [Pleuronectes platessa]|uniref:Serine/threonine-protein kinase haspin n=1 Tax=Pleuronectes platessa TaxID=8262 RepID=A0A9N7UQH9_PLEPL|nr:unnamed protein product [Pleuronectes platessa]